MKSRTTDQGLFSYKLNDDGSFALKGYNFAPPFVNFFPAIAGKYGVPMWLFYVNRGQCVSSLGVKDKDSPIMEFLPANKAFAAAPVTGFRTFIYNGDQAYEPFQTPFGNDKISQELSIRQTEFSITDQNPEFGTRCEAFFFTVPGETFSCLARRLSVTNISDKTVKLQIVDGLPQIVPFGTFDFLLKNMSTTAEAWMESDCGAPAALFKMKVVVADSSKVERIKGAHFYMSILCAGQAQSPMRCVCDPVKIFGCDKTFRMPAGPVDFEKAVLSQVSEGRTPCAFFNAAMELKPGQALSIVQYIGRAEDSSWMPEITGRFSAAYFNEKRAEAASIVEDLCSVVKTKSASPAMDNYLRQSFIDNVLRGGFPAPAGKDNSKTAYLYSRKHGDPERDYNKFVILPSYFSSGEGNYRDVNQNRRSDVWMGCVKEENIVEFANLIQLDGYNPLVVKGPQYTLKDKDGLREYVLSAFLCPRQRLHDRVEAALENPFELLLELDRAGAALPDKDEFLSRALDFYTCEYGAVHGEGFWTDHWTYLLDLIESYLSIYPENLSGLLFNEKAFTFYDNSHIVAARSKRYVITANGEVRQYRSVIEDEVKKNVIASRALRKNTVRAEYGFGPVYETSLAVKLLCIVCNKLATLDPSGIGIEMEAGKPNWYDALNGLPGVFGSSTCETYELLRLCIFMLDSFEKTGASVSMPLELAEFLRGLHGLLIKSETADFAYWDASNSIKEAYRGKTRTGVFGKEESFSSEEICGFLRAARLKCLAAVNKAVCDDGIPYSYYSHEAASFTKETDQKGSESVRVSAFNCRPLPFFLEGAVHALRIEKDVEKALSLHQAVKQSRLYDRRLLMYKVNAPLVSEPDDIGRARTFTPGWLENESIWLHMQYKYLLELLRSGLKAEFYDELKRVFIPFMEPAVYGRSTLENSSFIVSSAHPDSSLWGRGFVARLSGSTAEVIHIWRLMCFGRNPFKVNGKGALELCFEPSIPEWLFMKANEGLWFECTFLGSTKVVYSKKRSGSGKTVPASVFITFKDGSTAKHGPVIPKNHALMIRESKAQSIVVELS